MRYFRNGSLEVCLKWLLGHGFCSRRAVTFFNVKVDLNYKHSLGNLPKFSLVY